MSRQKSGNVMGCATLLLAVLFMCWVIQEGMTGCVVLPGLVAFIVLLIWWIAQLVKPDAKDAAVVYISDRRADRRRGEPESVDKFRTKIRGVSRYREEVLHCRAGSILKLLREPHNPHDRNAVLLLNDRGGTVGYLSEYWASGVAPAMDAGWSFAARVTQVTGQEHDNPGLNIEVWRIGN